jgi:hypothetical protein
LPNWGAPASGRVRICAAARRPRNFLCYFWHEKAAFIYLLFIYLRSDGHSDAVVNSAPLRPP